MEGVAQQTGGTLVAKYVVGQSVVTVIVMKQMDVVAIVGSGVRL